MVFKNQISKLYNNKCPRNVLEEKLFSQNGFFGMASCLMDNEKIEAIAPIADNPSNLRRSKSSILRKWYIILTDKRLIIASPTLVLKEMTATSYRYSDITFVEAAKWNSLHIKVTSFDTLQITGTYLYHEQRDELLHIIEKHIYS